MVNGLGGGSIMSEEVEFSVPPMVRQGEIVQELSAQLPERVSGEWVSLAFVARSLSMYGQSKLHVGRPNGTQESALAPRSTDDLLEELRELMYRPGAGTWFSATWTLTKDDADRVSADVSFNYDEEPDWDPPIRPFNYALDLEDFPRDEEHIPGWLRERLDEAQRAAK